jgi:hypothetical protein
MRLPPKNLPDNFLPQSYRFSLPSQNTGRHFFFRIGRRGRDCTNIRSKWVTAAGRSMLMENPSSPAAR